MGSARTAVTVRSAQVSGFGRVGEQMEQESHTKEAPGGTVGAGGGPRALALARASSVSGSGSGSGYSSSAPFRFALDFMLPLYMTPRATRRARSARNGFFRIRDSPRESGERFS